jgi:hypothetical protein
VSPAPGPPGLVDHMLETLSDPSQVTQRFSPWEKSFLESVADQYARLGSLSPKQTAILERIYTEKTA